MSKTFAAIDIGTNTILLLIAAVKSGGEFEVLEDRAEITRLGEGVDHSRMISADAEKRGLGVLTEYVEICRRLKVNKVAAVGTSVFRDAQNSGEFSRRLKRDLDLELRILSGAEEAFYSFWAVQEGLSLGDGEALVVDVGGGSTEFVWGKEGRVQRVASLDLGSVRLTERFLHSDPVLDEEFLRLEAEVDMALTPLARDWGQEAAFQKLVGIGATFTTLAAIEKRLRRYSHADLHGSFLVRPEVQRQVRMFRTKTVAERKKIQGLEPGRADVILSGALLIERIMARFRFPGALCSDQGVRYGVLREMISKQHP
ncbi:MAG: Ppx/GppA family phosphatase [Deltaproteobacteria bacterium]|nr:Ppx/GppA family phosphatase [Deltaproteobacteria bacterium]